MVIKYIPYEILSHKRIVQSLYKRALRGVESHCLDPGSLRYQFTMIRGRFDANKNVADPVKAKALIAEAETEMWDKRHYEPMTWFESPNGIAYERELHTPDHYVDYWHPLEKSMYPDYFATREKRKLEYKEWYQKKYGKPSLKELEGHHH